MGLASLLLFGGCGGAKYKVDYNGAKALYEGAKDEYKAGEIVKLKYTLIATDTDYSFEVEGADAKVDWDNGYVITFAMPENDVKVSYTAKNTMVNQNYIN